MWMVDAKKMCKQHLIGEYRELFTFLGTLRKKKSVKGYFRNNLFEPLSLKSRYLEIRNEMLARGYEPFKFFDYKDSLLDYLGDDKNIKVDVAKSEADLFSRCPECEARSKL